MTRTPAHTVALGVLTLAAGAGLASLGGCNIVGPAAVMIIGEPDIQPVFGLDPTRPTVFFIDDRASRVPRRDLRTTIGQEAEEDLIASGVMPKEMMIQSRSLEPLLKAERFSRPMSIDAVGESVKADVVIYVVVDDFALSADGQTFSPTARLRVKVIDVVSKERLFPAPGSNSDWQTLSVKLPEQTENLPRTEAEVQDALQLFAKRVGRDLGMLFYKHAPLHSDYRLQGQPG